MCCNGKLIYLYKQNIYQLQILRNSQFTIDMFDYLDHQKHRRYPTISVDLSGTSQQIAFLDWDEAACGDLAKLAAVHFKPAGQLKSADEGSLRPC